MPKKTAPRDSAEEMPSITGKTIPTVEVNGTSVKREPPLPYDEKQPNKKRSMLFWIIPLITLFAFSLGAAGGYFYFKKSLQTAATPNKTPDIYSLFISEVYDKIKDNYWDKITEESLVTLYKLGTEKITGDPLDLKKLTKEEFMNNLPRLMKDFDENKKREFTANLSNIVLNNLSPFGRSGLYTTKQEIALKNTVSNIEPDKDPYKQLGIGKESTLEEITEAYKNLKEELEPLKESSPEAKKKLEDASQAFETLSDTKKKENFDKLGIQPTTAARVIEPNILYLPVKKISPTTYDELINDTSKFSDKDGLNTLILDLRGNIGGSIDLLPYLLGPFIGQNQYAYEFFHQGETTPYKTKTGFLPSLVRYKKVVALIDGATQSSAEVIASVIKKYNVGVLLGTTTKGWGTVEKVFSLENQFNNEEKYSMFLVHSLTVREDGQPIEGRGVDPLISTSDNDWPLQFSGYYDSNSLIRELKQFLISE